MRQHAGRREIFANTEALACRADRLASRGIDLPARLDPPPHHERDPPVARRCIFGGLLLHLGSPRRLRSRRWTSNCSPSTWSQHLLLMTAAPPLLLLGSPVLPLLHGLPKFAMRGALGPVLRFPPVQRIGHGLANPVFCWFAATAILIGWHVPSAFALGLGSEAWHHAGAPELSRRRSDFSGGP